MQHFPSASYLLIEAQEGVRGAGLQRFKAAHPGVVYEICAAGDREGEIQFEADDPLGGQAARAPFPANDVTGPMNTVPVRNNSE